EIHYGPRNDEVDGDARMLPVRNGEGSLDNVLCLPEHHIESFKEHFYSSL
ncbi:hypothetical protein TorRG33x02_245870, partial [Trema orientale]